MFGFYIGLFIISLIAWRMFFLDYKSISKKIQKQSTRQSVMYERIDKRAAHQETLQIRKDMELYRKLHLVSDNLADSLQVEFNTLGVVDTDAYLHKFIKAGLEKLYLGALVLGGSLVFSVLFGIMKVPLDALPNTLRWIATGYIALGLFQIFSIRTSVTTSVKNHVQSVERDFNKLFFHVYPYYSLESNNYRLADVLTKFNTLNPEMDILVNTIINDSKRSEEAALQNVIASYASSVKIVDFASKLLKCVNGNRLGPQYLRSMYDQIIAEEDRHRTEKEAKKQEYYIWIMMGTMILAIGFTLLGTLIEMI